uniref:Peptidase aspartic putative domain-containing protein n=1 Tax=Amphimedon queenslandica TaxID=400682 RepID=A0A1X7VWV8_AMPQE
MDAAALRSGHRAVATGRMKEVGDAVAAATEPDVIKLEQWKRGSNATLSAVEKFTYLQALIEGKARDAIAGLPLTEVNYTVAIGLSKKWFGDKERAKVAHMEERMIMESVLSDNHIFDLRRLYHKNERNVGSLEALGLGVDAYGALLTPIVVKRLQPELRLNLGRKVTTDDWKLYNIMRVFLEELEAKERASLPKQPWNSHSQLPQKHSRDFPTRTFFGGRESGCCSCKQYDHAPADCISVITHKARKAIIRE